MGDTENLERIARLLEEVRENQKKQLEQQAESLAIQKEQFQVFLKQQEKTRQIQDRAEAVQEKGAQVVNLVRRFIPFALAAVVVLIAYITWLLLRYAR